MRHPVYSSVMPTKLDPAHPREGQAGVVIGYPTAEEDPTGTRESVRWDADQAVTVEAPANLRQLG